MSAPSCRNPDATSTFNRLSNSWVLTCLLVPWDMKEAGSCGAAWGKSSSYSDRWPGSLRQPGGRDL